MPVLTRFGPCEGVPKTPIHRFVQIHRSAIVNLHHVSHVVRGADESADVHLRGRGEVLPVSRSYLHVFRQM